MPIDKKTLQQEKLIKAQEEQQRKVKEDAANKAKAEAERKAREEQQRRDDAKKEQQRKDDDKKEQQRKDDAKKEQQRKDDDIKEQQRKAKAENETKSKTKVAKKDWVKKKAVEFEEARKSKAEDEKSFILSSTHQESIKKSVDNIFGAKKFVDTTSPILEEYEKLLNNRNKCDYGFSPIKRYETETVTETKTHSFAGFKYTYEEEVKRIREEDGEKVETQEYKEYKKEVNKCESKYTKPIAKKLIEYRTEINKQKDDLIKAFNQIDKVQVLKDTKENFIKTQCESLHNTANEVGLKFNDLLNEYCSYNECSKDFISDFVICDREAFVSDGFPL
ncbi:hypothetical protein I862_03590 [endosymbiont of Acanthamoeba sp. UWC8]|uniref:hypothetical protein n=1 Tax=endosymbiont of Acanthamoeba sp. UWC8 TaxID=86106 RepID=UPI0004D10585|nr:hypothetical protein [endosymbiont of Acanthamoeba sp. UWC8]AIF81278.1 hypothetical protein I862_03590 [endosymbiont of Acanthamoeba sp. UWC8]